MSDSEKSLRERLREEVDRENRKAERDAKYEKYRKPKAMRRYERFANMGEDVLNKNSNDNNKK